MPDNATSSHDGKSERPIPDAIASSGSSTEKPHIRKLIVLIAAAAVAVTVIVNTVHRMNAPVIYLTDFVTINVDGYDGYGTATAEFDTNAFAKKADSLSFRKSYAKKYLTGRYDSASTDITDVVNSYVHIKLNKQSDLSNGDTITYDVYTKPNAYNAVYARFKAGTGKIKVRNLKPTTKMDVLGDINQCIAFDGANGSGIVIPAVSSAFLLDSELTLSSGITFKLSKTTGLSNGDEIKVSINDKYQKMLAKEYGIVPDRTEATIKVSGLSEADD